jgi:hypothetical protein
MLDFSPRKKTVVTGKQERPGNFRNDEEKVLTPELAEKHTPATKGRMANTLGQ